MIINEEKLLTKIEKFFLANEYKLKISFIFLFSFIFCFLGLHGLMIPSLFTALTATLSAILGFWIKSLK
jgi:hypothetical protein